MIYCTLDHPKGELQPARALHVFLLHLSTSQKGMLRKQYTTINNVIQLHNNMEKPVISHNVPDNLYMLEKNQQTYSLAAGRYRPSTESFE